MTSSGAVVVPVPPVEPATFTPHPAGSVTVIDGTETLLLDGDDPAIRLAERAREWLADGCELVVLVTPRDRPLILGDAPARAKEVTLLHAAKQYESVAQILAGTHWSRLHSLGLSDLRVIIAELPREVLRRHVAALVSAAQFAETEQRAVDIRTQWLARADDIADEDDPIRSMLDVEIARDLIRDIDIERGRGLAERVVSAGDRIDPRARARALHTLAKADMWEGTTEAFLNAERLLRDAISSYRMHGEDQWEAAAWLELGWTHNLSGAFGHSLEAIGKAVHLLGAASSQRASTLTFYADVLVEVGRYDEAETALSEAQQLANDRNDHAGLAYAAWGTARLRSRQRDLVGTLANLRQVELHRTDWYRRPAGAAFHGEAAEMLVHLGDEAGARMHLDRAERLEAHHHTITDVPNAMFEARFGDPERAGVMLEALIAQPDTWERNRWRYLIYAAWAAHRGGDEAGATELAALAARSVEVLGRPELIAIGEPELNAHFFGAMPSVEERWTVRLLGDFELRRNGVLVRVPPGNATWLVQFLAIAGVRTVDEITDHLWQDADTTTSRRRLRNLLNRIRTDCPGIVERDANRLRLSPACTVDLAEFERTVNEIAGVPAAERAGIARAAIAKAIGPLLSDVDDDTVAVIRERVRRHVVDLLDLVAADAVERADHGEAARLLDEAIALEPHDESRYVALATLLVGLRRPRSARDVVIRGLAVATDLDVEPSAALVELAHRVAAEV